MMLLLLFSGTEAARVAPPARRAAVVFLTWFLAITSFLYSQSIPTALGMAQRSRTSVAALVSCAAPRRAPRANLRTAWCCSGRQSGGAGPVPAVFRACRPALGPAPGRVSRDDGIVGLDGAGQPVAAHLSDAIAFRVDFKGEVPRRRALYWRGPVMWISTAHLAPGQSARVRYRAGRPRHARRVFRAARAA
jgi:hypothetical protein